MACQFLPCLASRQIVDFSSAVKPRRRIRLPPHRSRPRVLHRPLETKAVSVQGVDAGMIWSVLVLVNSVFYIGFIVRRREGSLLWTVLLALVTGPLCWFVWLAMRAGKRRAEQHR